MAIKYKPRKRGRDHPASPPGPAARPSSPRGAAPQRPAATQRPAASKPPRGKEREFGREIARQPDRRGRDGPRPGKADDRSGREPRRPRYEEERPRREAARQPERAAPRLASPPLASPPKALPKPAPIASAPRVRPPRDGGQWLYGRHAVAAALANPQRRIRRFLAVAGLADDAARLVVAGGARLPPGPQPEILPRAAFEALVPAGAVHQGVALAVESLPDLAIEDVIDRVGPPPAPGAVAQIVLLLDQVTDPHNIGAILRSAAAFGALALVLPDHGAPPITGTLAKAASGAVEHVPILRVVNLVRAIDRLKSAGFWCVGLAEDAEQTLAALKLEGRIALVLGGEGEGMRRLTRERCDLVARLPTSGAIASLNVSNAAAIALYELARGNPIRS
jgi:23S rRNA (guanosine2251-2'-O)-methyltransferase